MKDTGYSQTKNRRSFLQADLAGTTIRPTAPGQIDAVGAANTLIANRLFIDQSPEFNQPLRNMAQAPDSAKRH
jgi:hypothetical protein